MSSSYYIQWVKNMQSDSPEIIWPGLIVLCRSTCLSLYPAAKFNLLCDFWSVQNVVFITFTSGMLLVYLQLWKLWLFIQPQRSTYRNTQTRSASLFMSLQNCTRLPHCRIWRASSSAYRLKKLVMKTVEIALVHIWQKFARSVGHAVWQSENASDQYSVFPKIF